MNLHVIATARAFLTRPTEAFSEVRYTPLADAILYYGALFLFSVLMVALIGLALFPSDTTGMLSPFPNIVSFAAIRAVGLILTVAFWLWLHMWVSLVGGGRGVAETVKAILYASTPGLAFGWIPVIGSLFAFWGFALMVIGIRELQEISTGKTVVALAIAVFIPSILAVFGLMVFLPAPLAV